MEDVNLIGESIKFMVLGMSVVFLFLLILVQVVKLQAAIIGKFFPEVEPEIKSTTSVDNDEAQRTAAIIAAVTEFRKK
ncbi:MAG: Oxaloacetate decarboxylase gamma chain (EC [uncultured Sulfurovum sp.]|uniref:Probable oxaloacetate decarboxylase gamma chain n=1 Tax=uncultured Sulfurovum sp. TaxID=269237 RepID=A0A6S6UDJ5_9BACT|nr:MAG: Oxaloacetate decarboxylase gamma chain (EC [uncultured Sulfurovum sp.]